MWTMQGPRVAGLSLSEMGPCYGSGCGHMSLRASNGRQGALRQVHADLKCLVLQAVGAECRRLQRRRGWARMRWTVTGAHHPLAFIMPALP